MIFVVIGHTEFLISIAFSGQRTLFIILPIIITLRFLSGLAWLQLLNCFFFLRLLFLDFILWSFSLLIKYPCYSSFGSTQNTSENCIRRLKVLLLPHQIIEYITVRMKSILIKTLERSLFFGINYWEPINPKKKNLRMELPLK